MLARNTAMLGSICLVLVTGGCGMGVAGSSSRVDPSATASNAVKGKAGCTVDPDPVYLGNNYVLLGQGMPRNVSVAVTLVEPSRTTELTAVSDNDGRFTLDGVGRELGIVDVGLSVERKRGWVEVGGCSFAVINVPVCGNGTCDAGEDCGNCEADCGACAAFCGNGTCDAGEDCGNCEADCGACAAFCGDGTCDAGEDCGNCEADCGACASCEPAVSSVGSGRHNAGKVCFDCHGKSAIAFGIAGTLYDAAAGNAPVEGATIVVLDARGREYKLVTQGNGNFYTTDTSMSFPVQVKASKCPDEQLMSDNVAASGASCNACHSAGSRIHLP